MFCSTWKGVAAWAILGAFLLSGCAKEQPQEAKSKSDTEATEVKTEPGDESTSPTADSGEAAIDLRNESAGDDGSAQAAPTPATELILTPSAATPTAAQQTYSEPSTAVEAATAAATAAPTEAPTPEVATPAPSTEESTAPATDESSAAVAAGTVQASIPEEPAVPLDQSSSPYLRQAAKSPVKWQTWSSAAFDQARELDRPVLIDIGANWNHSSKLMNSSTYADPEVVKLLNDNFVTIKVDCDERPDIYVRYQIASYLVRSEAAGYPLTVFALPDGRPFEAVQYTNASDMRDVLQGVVDIYKQQKDQAIAQAEQIEKVLAQANVAPEPQGKADAKFVSGILDGIMQQYDSSGTGFGPKDQPRQPNGNSLLFLLHYFSDTGDKKPLDAASNVLGTYSRSGLRDHVLGGYFHYSMDAGLTKPRHEKLLYIQAELLSANCLAYAATGRRSFTESANEILKVCRDTFENRDGGFYSSQDADMGADDDGSYFTWTKSEVEKIAGTGSDTKVFMRYLNVDGEGSGRKVLHADDKLAAAASAFDVKYEDGQKALDNVRKKLHDARMTQEKVPYVNKTIMASWNGLMISAYLDAFKYMGDKNCRDFALKSADFVLANMVSETNGVAHSWYKDKASVYGLLEDHVYLAAALLQCFEVSGDKKYLEATDAIMDYVESVFLDSATGLYRDHAAGTPAGLLAVKRLPVNDTRIASPNAIAAMNWYHLALLHANDDFMKRAQRLVNAVAGYEGLKGTSAATYGRAAAMIVNTAPKALIIGKSDDASTKEMHAAALPAFRMGKIVEVLPPEEAAKTDYPPSKDGKAIAYVCTSQNCAPPVKETAKIAEVLKTFGKPEVPEKASGDGESSGNGEKEE